MKKYFGIGLLAVALCTPAAATAAFKTGAFKGSSAHGPISFKLSKKAVTGLKFKVTFECTDGDRFSSNLKGFPKVKVSQAKKGIVFSNGDNSKRFLFRIDKLKGKTAKGVVQAKWTFDENDIPDPEGSVVCDSAVQKFTAKRR